MTRLPADGQDGRGDAHTPDGVNSQGAAAGEGGAYPNPHTGKGGADGSDEGSDVGGFMGHGGQSAIDYHGSQQLGAQDVDGSDNGNAATKGE